MKASNFFEALQVEQNTFSL